MHILIAETNSRDYGGYQRFFFQQKFRFQKFAKRFWQKKQKNYCRISKFVGILFI